MTNNHIFLKGIVLPLSSIHGSSHWQRVERFGLKIAEANGADREVVSLFAYLHDARRVNDDDDPSHGERAVVLLDELIKENIINLTTKQYQQLAKALSIHNQTDARCDDITVQTCWDADRLDLWRCGIIPDPKLMYTSHGKSPEMIEYARELNKDPLRANLA